MKILLLGKNGQVGWELQRSLAVLGQVYALDRHSHPGADLSQLEALTSLVLSLRPDVIVNAAAYTAVDQAQTEPELAHRINAQAVQCMAAAAAELGALLVHYSTDYVFDGSGTEPWREDAHCAPLNVYGQTKRAGEEAILASGCKHLIFRTSWVYGNRGQNFAKTMCKLALERDELRVINDQFGAPTAADLIADVTAHALRQVFKEQADYGLYHLCASGVTTWYDYARTVLETAQRLNPSAAWRCKHIQPVAASTWASPATRPLNSRLDTEKLCRQFALHLPPWQHGVERLVAQIAVSA